MSGANLFIVIGVAALVAGGITLVRPDLVRGLLGLGAGDGATYGLRIAAMMIASFGLLLAGFAIGYERAAPLEYGSAR